MSNAVTALAGIHSIDHFALRVPDLAKAEDFFRTFGLATRNVGDELTLNAADGHCWGRIFPGKKRELAYLSLNCFERDFDVLVAQILAEKGRALPPGSAYVDDKGFWFHDPDGNILQIKIGPKTMPNVKAPNALIDVPCNQRGSSNRGVLPPVRPRRLSHVLLFTPDVLKSLDFYTRALGLKLSDRSQDVIAFTHGKHGSDHHLIAFVKSERPGWHHSAWDVDGVDEVGRGAAQMEAAGYAEGWGTGRHVLGSNYFFYVRDPWGSFAEYSAHIDYIAKDHEWPSADHPLEDSLYQWGPPVPPYFTKNL
ncbi:MAG TPA: VOC family protein [Herbaspirillum sp.]|jgi:catechol 2,3-dioxygenase-like lactoylglutathione lyase family enzyme